MTGPIRETTGRRVARGAALTLTGLFAILLEAAPLGLHPLALPSPDLLACVLLCWAVRAPRAVPLALVFVLGVLRDMVTDVPPGLGALTLVLACETIKAVHERLLRRAFLAEWLWVAGAVAGMLALQWLGVLVSLAQPPYPAQLFQQFTATLIAYPLVVLFARGVLRAPRRRPDPV